MTDAEADKAMQATLAGIEKKIRGEHYINAGEATGFPQDVALKTLTICILILDSGFTVVGTSASSSTSTFDATVGKKIARANAVNAILPLEGYLAKQGPSAA